MKDMRPLLFLGRVCVYRGTKHSTVQPMTAGECLCLFCFPAMEDTDRRFPWGETGGGINEKVQCRGNRRRTRPETRSCTVH